MAESLYSEIRNGQTLFLLTKSFRKYTPIHPLVYIFLTETEK